MDDQRPISSLPLSPSLIELLLKNNFRVTKSLLSMKPLDLTRELNISASEAIEILKCVDRGDKKGCTAKELLAQGPRTKSIRTFCQSLDEMMGRGGVPIGQLTEFCGSPGIGKTQLAMQLCLDVQIPEVLGGNGAEAVYIDTEGSMLVERLAEMADALSIHLMKIARSRSKSSSAVSGTIDYLSIAEGMKKERLLEHVNIFRVHDLTELLAVINNLDQYLKLKTNVRLVVIDSIAFHFRGSTGGSSSSSSLSSYSGAASGSGGAASAQAARSRLLSSVAQTLNKVAFEFNVAVVVTNHVTFRFSRNSTSAAAFNSSSASTSALVPAMGEQWSHCITNRVMLHYVAGERTATISKSPAWAPGSATFRITEDGVRGLSTVVISTNTTGRGEAEYDASKRARVN